MTEDIVIQLRVLTVADTAESIYETMTEAADEIERLRTERDEWRGIAGKLAFWGSFSGKGLAAFHEWQQSDHKFLKAVRNGS